MKRPFVCLKARTAFSKSEIASILVFISVGVIIFLRRPDALLNPQPWAEDGPVFIQQAMEYSFGSVFIPYWGYYYVLQRLVTILSLSFGLINTPLLMNFSALLLSAFSISYLSWKRFRVIIRNDIHRYLLCVLIACLPVPEIFLNITNIQWFLSLYVTLWVSGQWLDYDSVSRRRRRTLSVIESALAAVVFLSGPISFILLPVLALTALRRVRDDGLFSMESVICLVPIVSLLVCMSASIIALGAIRGSETMTIPSILSLVTAFSTQVVGTLLVPGPRVLFSEFGFWPAYAVSACVVAFLLCTAVKKRDVLAFWFGSLVVLSLSSIGVFRPSALVFLVSVAITGIRYVFYPMCLLLILLVRNINTFPKKGVKVCLCIILIVVAFNSALQYEISPFVDFKFRSYAQEFDPDGHYSLFVPINPGWIYMRIPSNPELTATRLRSTTRMDGGIGAIDTIDNKSIHQTSVVVDKCKKRFIVLTGWAIDEEAKDIATTVYLVLDGNLAFPTSYGMSRLDVARSLGNPSYEHSGWLGTIPIENLTIGSHEVSIWIVSTGGRYYDVNDGVAFEVACVLAES